MNATESTTRVLLVLTVAAGVAACSASRREPAVPAYDTRYLYRLLDTRKLGAEELARIQKTTPAVAEYVAKAGKPDFLIEPSVTDVELVYYLKSVLAHFHRGADGKWTMSELTPLPTSCLNILPGDIRAGTPMGTGDEQVGCWTTTIPGGSCRTCCTPAEQREQACTIQCTPGKS